MSNAQSTADTFTPEDQLSGGEQVSPSQPRTGHSGPLENRLETDANNAADDLVRLVLALIETLRQLMEKQAIRKVENGSLKDEEIEHLGLTLMRLEQRMEELKEHFGLEQEDLTLRLGSLGDLKEILGEDRP
ncbi:gas vesicle protein K [Flexibacterium corallicola]|uniref:gas vesicle protein K n=1 Tax=Flexibacterium corallicola TaxID=3037259 RepID=UPI00286EEC34|nr:gas vesicle protein K [Pseudovibrio sp. M1P-2-3]